MSDEMLIICGDDGKLRGEKSISGPRAERFLLRMVRAGYLSVDERGHIWRLISSNARRKPRLAPCSPVRADMPHVAGYRVVRVMNRGRRYCVLAHRLVFLVNFGAIHVELEINHKDGVKSNNAPSNLEAISHRDNTLHAVATGLLTRKPGEAVHNAKLTDEAVRTIRAGGATAREFANRFGVTPAAINSVIARRTWTHVR